MKIKQFTLLCTVSALLVACANTSEKITPRATRLQNIHNNLSTEAKVADETKGGVRVYAGYSKDYSANNKADEYPAKYLRVINPADNSKVLAGKIVQGILGNGTLGYSKYQLKGKRTDVLNQSIPAAYQPVRDYLFQQFGSANQTDVFPFQISADHFYLVYDTYTGDKNTTRQYELVQDITFKKIREDVGETSKTFRQFQFHCKQKDVKHTMPEWQANNYHLLHETAKQYAKNCANELLSKHKADLHAAYIR